MSRTGKYQQSFWGNLTLSTSFPAAPLLLHPFLLLQRFTQALPPDCPTLCLASMLVCTNPQGFHKKREGKVVLKSKRMGPSPLLSLVTSSRFLTQLCAGQPMLHPLQAAEHSRKGQHLQKNSFQGDRSLPTQKWELEHKGKGTDAAGNASSSRTGSEPKGCTSWDNTIPILPEPAHSFPQQSGMPQDATCTPAALPAHGCIWENSISPPTGFQRAGRGVACGSRGLS